MGLLSFPASGGGTLPVGVIVSSNDASLSNLNAAQGTDVYPGDTLVTSPDGSLRLAMGLNQLYLFGATQATMLQDSGTARAKVDRGTVDFSTAPGQIEVETPLGIVRGNGTGRSFGQVSVLNGNEITVQAMKGNLELIADGEPRTVPAGTAYRFVAEPEPAQGPEGYPNTVRQHHRKRKIAAFIILGGAALASYGIWNALTVSPTTVAP